MSYVFHKIAFKKLTPGRVVRTLNGKSFVKLDIEKLVTPTHSHKYGSIWMSDQYTHWHECSCTDRTDIAVHLDRDGDGKCDICRHTLPVDPWEHTHEYGSIWSSDEHTHWRECSCGDRTDITAHADTNGDGKCDTCGYVLPVVPPSHTHEYDSNWNYDKYTHWQECSCGSRINITVHTDTNGDGKCDTCGYVLPVEPSPHTHEYGSSWSHDAYTHWQECSCGKRGNISVHADNNKDGKCDTCGYSMPIPPEPEIPPILIDKDRIDLRIFGFEPGCYILRVTAEAMSLRLSESDKSDPIEYIVN